MKSLPWFISAILVAGLLALASYHQHVVGTKEAELQVADQRYKDLVEVTDRHRQDLQNELKDVVATAGRQRQDLQNELKDLDAAANQQKRDLQGQIAEADAKVQLVASEARAKVEALAAEAKQKLAEANLPEVSAAVSFPKSAFSNGYFATVKNIGNQPTAFSLSIFRPSSGERRSMEVTLDAQKSKEIGQREGWTFLQEDRIFIKQAGHKSLVFSFK